MNMTESSLKEAFLDIKSVYQYGENIYPISLEGKILPRVWSHILLVPEYIFLEAIKSARYKQDIQKNYEKILSSVKIIHSQRYVTLVDNKTDQTREVIDYIIQQNIITKLYVISPDSMFWFFHDIWHGYLSETCNNFYENVYGTPEMLVNIFACIKQKQYKMYSRRIVDREIGEKCTRYDSDDKKYFFKLLDSLHLQDDIL